MAKGIFSSGIVRWVLSTGDFFAACLQEFAHAKENKDA